MKKTTITKINEMVINYLSIVGLSNEQEDFLDNENPILTYFYKYILNNNDEKNNTENKISRILFYNMIKESYRIYKKIDTINHHNSNNKTILIEIIGNEESYDVFIKQILKQFKDSLFNIIMDYNGKDKEYLDIKINLLEERMIFYGKNDDFDNAIKLQNNIKILKVLK